MIQANCKEEEFAYTMITSLSCFVLRTFRVNNSWKDQEKHDRSGTDRTTKPTLGYECAMLFGKKKEDKKYVIHEQESFVDNYSLFKYIGMINDGGLYSKIRAPISIVLLFYGLFHHIVPMVAEYDKLDFDEMMDLIHLEMVYLMWCLCWIPYILKTDLLAKLLSQIKGGLFNYSTSLSNEEKIILSRANDKIIRVSKIGAYVYIVGGIGIFLKGIKKENIEKLSLPNKGWFPFAITTLPRYLLGCFCQAILGINAVCIAIGTFLSFFMLMVHYEAQFKLLMCHLKSTFPVGVSMQMAKEERNKLNTLKRLRDCYYHHLAILEFHQDVLKYYGIMLLVFRMAIVLQFCTLAYIAVMTDVSGHGLLRMSSYASSELLFVSVFSLKGQGVSDWSNNWKATLYGMEWWEQPKEVQNNIKILILGATEPLEMYGVWKIAAYSHAGLFAIGNESFSFFNMLRAIK